MTGLWYCAHVVSVHCLHDVQQCFGYLSEGKNCNCDRDTKKEISSTNHGISHNSIQCEYVAHKNTESLMKAQLKRVQQQHTGTCQHTIWA